jgi:hypothetical protein
MPRSKKTTKKTAPKKPVEQAPVMTKQATTPPVPSVTAAQASSATTRQKPRRLSRMAIPAAILFLAVAGISLWFFVLRSPDVAGENQQLLKEVSKLAVVPKDEVPSVTTVVDTTKVNQEFLRIAKKGDKVLLYFQEGRAIVYRPSTHQIVNMGPLETPKPRVFLRDGTGTSNLDAVADKVTATNEFLFASRDISPIKQYEKTVVVDLTGNRPDVAKRLARLLGVPVIKLPEGESKPDGDMLVIVGKDSAPGQPAAGSPEAAAPVVQP